MPLRLAFDFISPYAYLVWKVLPALAERHGVGIEPVPVLFGGMLSHHENIGPAEIPAKRTYTMLHVARTAALEQIPMGMPPCHPFNPLLALRVACLDMDAATRTVLIDRLFDAVWSPAATGVTDPEHVLACCEGLGLIDPIGSASAPAIKQRVRDQTDRAIAEGAFGVPTIWADDAMFWGYDALPHLERHLTGALDPAQELLERWEALPTAHRKR